ncbi:MAG: peptidylprolyl isomerase [Micropepsaceae bacterium]
MISVNGVQIGESAILAEMQYHPAETREGALNEAAEALVVRELLLQRAAELEMSWDDGDVSSEDKTIQVLLAQELKVPKPDVHECRRYFNNNTALFRSQDLFEVSHILFLAPRDDAAVRQVAMNRARETLEILKLHPGQFTEIARAESRCASSGEGGRLGQVAAGETAPEIDTFIHALEDGQLCPVPVETEYGVHVLLLHRRIPGRQFAFEDVEQDVARKLTAGSWSRAVSGYISLLAAAAKIDGIDVRRAETPLVQ